MIRTHPVKFASVDQRNDVHDAVKGRAQALSEDDDQLRSLFDVGQTLAYIEKNEPPNNHHLTIRFAFESENEYERAVNVLTGLSDDDLDWLGNALDDAGIDESYDADEDDLPGGISEAFRTS